MSLISDFFVIAYPPQMGCVEYIKNVCSWCLDANQVIQDHSVQTLMDELDLPPDRANLFEVIDADGSGTLHITELVQADR